MIRPPRLRSQEEGDGERHATWLELFFDLIFVVAVAQLGAYLSKHVTLEGVGNFALLFILVWWTWIGTTFYASRFDTDDIVDRLATLGSIFAAVVMAANVTDAFGETGFGFALAYAAARVVLVVQYVIAGRHVPEARPLTNRFALGFGLAAIVWAVSAFVPTPWRFLFWAVGMAIDIGTPLTAGKLHGNVAPSVSHLPERFGLFTLIVLGEGVAAVVRATSEQEWRLPLVLTAGCGVVIAFSLWWIYFEYTDGAPILAAREEGRVNVYNLWLYTHLPLTAGIVAVGVGVEHIVASEAGKLLTLADRWLLCGAVAVCWLAIGIIQLIYNTLDPGIHSYRRLIYRSFSVAGALLLAIFGGDLPPLALIAVTDPHDDAALGDVVADQV